MLWATQHELLWTKLPTLAPEEKSRISRVLSGVQKQCTTDNRAETDSLSPVLWFCFINCDALFAACLGEISDSASSSQAAVLAHGCHRKHMDRHSLHWDAKCRLPADSHTRLCCRTKWRQVMYIPCNWPSSPVIVFSCCPMSHSRFRPTSRPVIGVASLYFITYTR